MFRLVFLSWFLCTLLVMDVCIGKNVLLAQDSSDKSGSRIEEVERNVKWSPVGDPFVIDGYEVNEHRLTFAQRAELDQFYENVKGYNFALYSIRITGHGDGKLKTGADATDANKNVAEMRAYYAKQYIVGKGKLVERDISIGFQHDPTLRIGSQHRKIVLQVLTATTLDSKGNEVPLINARAEALSDEARKAAEKAVADAKVKSQADEDKRLASLIASMKAELKQEIMNEITIPEPGVFKVGFGDMNVDVNVFHDFTTPLHDTGLFFRTGVSLELFPFLALRGLLGIGGSDLGWSWMAGGRLEYIVGKDDDFRLSLGFTRRGFKPESDDGNVRTLGDQWIITGCLGYNFLTYLFLEGCSGYGWASRVVDDEGALYSKGTDVTESYWDASASFGVLIPLRGRHTKGTE